VPRKISSRFGGASGTRKSGIVCEEGQFFKAHQDSERDDHMVASLVVVLPSDYEGGSLTVEHRGEKKTNGDRTRARALRAAAEHGGCEAFLALAQVHETWTCEDTGDEGYRARPVLLRVFS